MNRDSTLERLFGRGVPRPFPEADASVLRVIGKGFDVQPEAREEVRWVDSEGRRVYEWDLLHDAPRDVRVSWDEQFEHRKYHWEASLTAATIFEPADVAVTRRILDPVAGDGTFLIRITNPTSLERPAVYSEIWPWWLKGWMHEMTVSHRQSPSYLCAFTADVQMH